MFLSVSFIFFRHMLLSMNAGCKTLLKTWANHTHLKKERKKQTNPKKKTKSSSIWSGSLQQLPASSSELLRQQEKRGNFFCFLPTNFPINFLPWTALWIGGFMEQIPGYCGFRFKSSYIPFSTDTKAPSHAKHWHCWTTEISKAKRFFY